MPTARRQNVAIAVIFLALGGVLLLTVAPFELGTIRLAGVSVLWWYGALAAPVVSVAVTVAVLAPRDHGGPSTRAESSIISPLASPPDAPRLARRPSRD